MTIEPAGALKLEAFADADWATELSTRRSTTGLIVKLANVPLGWVSAKQNVVAMSSMESEIRTLSAFCSELIWYNQLARDMELQQSESPICV